MGREHPCRRKHALKDPELGDNMAYLRNLFEKYFM